MVGKQEQLAGYIEQMIKRAGSGHYASSMSALEIMYPLFYEQGIKPDEFILSKGHAAPALYAILYDLGYIKSIDNFREFFGLPGHPSIETDGVLVSSGSLGMGISKALGLAHANKDKIYHVLVGDGELQEGQNWEAFRYIEGNDIKNITIHVDFNGYQYSGLLQDGIRWDDERIIIHETTWKHDNHYLTIPKDNPKVVKYSGQLFDIMVGNENAIVLNADLEHDFGLTTIKESFPDRYIQCGISEQHMVSMAGGLARAGKLPICHTFGAFYRRAIDQMYNNGCDKLKVVYVAGLTEPFTNNIGMSHETTDWNYYTLIVPNLVRIESFENILNDSETSYYLEVW